jgi:hypothetical protein
MQYFTKFLNAMFFFSLTDKNEDCIAASFCPPYIKAPLKNIT